MPPSTPMENNSPAAFCFSSPLPSSQLSELLDQYYYHENVSSPLTPAPSVMPPTSEFDPTSSPLEHDGYLSTASSLLLLSSSSQELQELEQYDFCIAPLTPMVSLSSSSKEEMEASDLCVPPSPFIPVRHPSPVLVESEECGPHPSVSEFPQVSQQQDVHTSPSSSLLLVSNPGHSSCSPPAPRLRVLPRPRTPSLSDHQVDLPWVSPMPYHLNPHLSEALSASSIPKKRKLSDFSSNFFPDSRVNNSGGIIVNIYQTVQVRDQSVTNIPSSLIVYNAMHTGYVRTGLLECDPNTRQAVLKDIIFRIKDNQQDQPVLWLHGPAGIGKSAIAKTIADKIEREDTNLQAAWSFFFLRSDPERNDLKKFVPTLVHQMRIRNEALRKKIDAITAEDAGIFHSRVDVQWRRLVVETVKSIPCMSPAIFIIDGLDECHDTDDQMQVLELVASCGPGFPIRFLITSRYSPRVASCFDTEPLSSLCRHPIDLSDYRDPLEMKTFIRARFLKIYSQYEYILKSHLVNDVWPSDDVVDEIIRKADGRFLYLVTLFRLIVEGGTRNTDPETLLRNYLKEDSKGLSLLDVLCTEGSCTREDFVVYYE